MNTNALSNENDEEASKKAREAKKKKKKKKRIKYRGQFDRHNRPRTDKRNSLESGRTNRTRVRCRTLSRWPFHFRSCSTCRTTCDAGRIRNGRGIDSRHDRPPIHWWAAQNEPPGPEHGLATRRPDEWHVTLEPEQRPVRTAVERPTTMVRRMDWQRTADIGIQVVERRHLQCAK